MAARDVSWDWDCLELDDKLVIYDILVKRMHLCLFSFYH